jgi:hypothetical protein
LNAARKDNVMGLDLRSFQAFADELEKVAVIGPLIDLNFIGLPSLVAHTIARGSHMDEETAAKEKNRKYNIAAGLLVPGYTGYHYGKKSRGGELVDRRALEKRLTAEKRAALGAVIPAAARALPTAGRAITSWFRGGKALRTVDRVAGVGNAAAMVPMPRARPAAQIPSQAY